MPRTLVSTAPQAERVFLVGARVRGRTDQWTAEDSLKELGELSKTVGAQIVGSMIQHLGRPTRVYLGKGKLEELKLTVKQHRVDTVICDDELTPTQQRNLEDVLGITKVIDRTALILDVFARRAQTKEGRLQVDLAQHEYLLPRLAGQWSHLERLGGGIGTRGPGETQLETDRRLVGRRIQRLRRSLEDVRRHRSLYRARRKERQLPVVSLVGYTNAGKSTLLNRVTGAGVAVENKLFSTLDPITRRISLSSGRRVLLTDTVGFIQKLPPKVVAAFRATLEEVEEAALLVHILDITHPNAPEQAQVVEKVLYELGLSSKPRVLALNKIDLFTPVDRLFDEEIVQKIAGQHRRVVAMSALRGIGIDRLLAEIDEVLSEVVPVAAG